MKRYKSFDHTADLGVEIFGRDEKELFTNAGYALFDLITDPGGIRDRSHLTISIEGLDWEDLMVNWLRELLSLFNSKKYLPGKFLIDNIREDFLRAEISGEEFCSDRHLIKCEIKAVTYHKIEVKKQAGGWMSRVIFDV